MNDGKIHLDARVSFSITKWGIVHLSYFKSQGPDDNVGKLIKTRAYLDLKWFLKHLLYEVGLTYQQFVVGLKYASAVGAAMFIGLINPHAAHIILVSGAITLDLSKNGLVDSSQTLTINQTIGGSTNKLISQASVWGSGRIVTGVTWNSVALTVAKQNDSAGVSNNASIWYLDSPGIGTFNLVITATTSTAFIRGTVVSLIGAATGGPDSTAGASGGFTSATNGLTTNITTVANSCWIFDAILDQNNDMTAGASQTDNFDVTDTTSRGSYKSNVSAGANTMAWTWTGTEDGVTAVAAFAPAASNTIKDIIQQGMVPAQRA